MQSYSLTDLPYSYDALQPIISNEIMELHHDKHHAGYVNGTNASLEKLAKARAGELEISHKAIMRDLVKVDYVFESCLTINESKDYQWLIDTIKKNNYGVVIFDTLTTLHDKEENSSKEMREVNKLMLN